MYYKKTDKKVKVTNGTRTYTRTVWVSELGNEYFKDDNEWHHIYMYTNKRGDTFPKSMFYNDVKYV